MSILKPINMLLASCFPHAEKKPKPSIDTIPFASNRWYGIWQGQKGSNPQERFWRPLCYHYIMPLRLVPDAPTTRKRPVRYVGLYYSLSHGGLQCFFIGLEIEFSVKRRPSHQLSQLFASGFAFLHSPLNDSLKIILFEIVYRLNRRAVRRADHIR